MSKLSFTQESPKRKYHHRPTLAKLITLAVILTIGNAVGLASAVHADRFDAQIKQLRSQNNSATATVQTLEATEETLATKIAGLQASISGLETQINKHQAQVRQIRAKIKVIEAELVEHRVILGISIRQIYFDEQITTLEKVAASRDFSEFADKEQYNLAVKNKIKTTVDQINVLKEKQEASKKRIEKILAEQKTRQAQLDKNRAESARLLSLNRAEQAAYDRKISRNNSKIAQLRAEQAAINLRSFSGGISYSGTGSYPWANVYFPNTLSDPWGMYKRQCVSYTAWKVAASGRHMPYWGGRGNANRWDDNARAAGIPVGYSPRVGDVAISNAGTYGHAMYVEKVHGDGTITISQYNAGWDGRYSVARRGVSGLVFIHFR